MRKHLAVLLAYLILALLLTLPLAAHFASHVPGDGIDDPALAWNLWWVRHAFVDAPQNPFDVTWQFWPIGINLAFYTLTILNGLLSIPLQAVFGLIPAYNVLLLLSFVLGGFGAYLLCLEILQSVGIGTRRHEDTKGAKREEREGVVPDAGASRSSRFAPFALLRGFVFLIHSPSHAAAFLAGAVYAFASSKLFYASLGQGNIASSQWVPFAVLYLVRAARPGGRGRDAVLAALFIVLQAYAELTYASFLLVFAGLAAVWGLVDVGRARRAERMGRASSVIRLIGRFAVIGGLFLIGIAPVLANMLPDLAAEGDFFTAGGGFADLFSADLAGYAVPTQLHPLLGDIVRGWSARAAAAGRQFPVDKGQHIVVGYGVGLVALYGLWHGRRRGATWFWAAATLVFFLLTLGPSLRIAGHDTGIPLPFRIMEQLPFFKGNRYPSRYSVMLMVSLTPLVALGATWVVGRVSRWGGAPDPEGIGLRGDAPSTGLNARAAALLLPLLLFEHLSVPLPLFDLRVPALYQRVAALPGDFALLELPLGWRNGARVAGKKDIVIMQQLWNQSAHGKRLLGGNTSRNPEYKFQYFSEDPVLARLIALTNAADTPQHDALRAGLAATPITDAERDHARQLAAFFDIRYVMVHRDQLPPETEQAVRELLPLTLVAEDGPLALYEVGGDADTLPDARVFEPGTTAGRMVLGEGWSPASLAAAPGAAPPPAAIAERREPRLLLPLPAGPVTLTLEGWSLAPDQAVTLVVDGQALGTQALPESPATLAFAVPADPARPPLSDVRLRFAHTIPVAEWAERSSAAGPAGLLVRSAGEETGNFAHIYVDGVEQSPGGRGYNLVALDPAQGRVLAAASFDTHADPAANTRMAQWIAALPPGAWVAGAVRDEASLSLSEEGVAALRALGVRGDLREHFRWGHAFIGHTGPDAAPPSEALDGWRVAQVSYGLPVSQSAVAAALLRLRVQEQRELSIN